MITLDDGSGARRTRRRPRMILFMGLLTLAVPNASGQTDAWESLMEKGARLSETADFKEAIPHVEKAAKLSLREDGLTGPRHLRSLSELAWLYWSAGKTAKAEGLLRRMERMRPRTAEMGISIGKAYLRMRDYARAEEFLAPVAAEPSAQQEALSNLGEVYMNSGKYENAAECYKRLLPLLDKNEGFWVYIRLAEAYARSGNPRMAKQVYERIDPLELRDREDLVHLGYAFESMGEPAKARKVFETAGAYTTYHHLARQFMESGKLERAAAYYEKALDKLEKSSSTTLFDRVHTTSHLSSVYLSLGRNDDAETLARGFIERDWEPEGDIYQQGHLIFPGIVFLQIGKAADAEAFFRRYLASVSSAGTPPDVIGLVTTFLATSLFEQGKISETRTFAQEAIRSWDKASLHSGNAPEYLYLAGMLERIGDHKERRRVYEKVLSTPSLVGDPSVINASLGLARLQADQGRFDKAEDLCRNVLDVLARPPGLTQGAKAAKEKETLEILKRIYDAQGRERESAETQARLKELADKKGGSPDK